jgi:iron complex transport system permease protein
VKRIEDTTGREAAGLATAALSVKAEGRINISAPAMQLSLVWMLCGFGLLIALSLLSLLLGTRMLSPDVLLQALSAQDRRSAEQIILLDYRLPLAFRVR